jgi:hypothetical protein
MSHFSHTTTTAKEQSALPLFVLTTSQQMPVQVLCTKLPDLVKRITKLVLQMDLLNQVKLLYQLIKMVNSSLGSQTTLGSI